MSSSLALVIEIMNLVDEAEERGHLLDLQAEAQRLLLVHPDADTTAEEIAAMLRQQQSAWRQWRGNERP